MDEGASDWKGGGAVRSDTMGMWYNECDKISCEGLYKVSYCYIYMDG